MTGDESEYRRKRHFGTTPEPPAEVIEGDVDPLTAPVGNQFVIQQHYATGLHHDVRLEMMNREKPVLVSWAVPKGLPTERGERHLAIHTEDHPMGYTDFEGTIPEGEYGGGEVRIFDRGRWELVDRNEERLTFRLRGDRLVGIYHLIRTEWDDGKDQWLALLSEDQRPAAAPPPPPRPMLATLTSEAFDDPQWGFEPKWDGIRAIAICDAATRLVSRNGRDVSAAYPELAGLHRRLVALQAMLDGEVVAMEGGKPSFQLLQQRMHVRDHQRVERLVETTPVTFMAFDLLYLDGGDVTALPLTERRRLLEKIIVPSDRIQVSPLMEGEGKALFRAAAEQGLEGVVAKRLDSSYELGSRSQAWLKVKVIFEADVVIVGWTDGEGSRRGLFGSLVMAVYDDGELRYVGNVGTGFDSQSLSSTFGRLMGLGEVVVPFDQETMRRETALRGVHWVGPELVASVEHRELTAAGKLRAPSFKGFRDDKDPTECTFEQLAAEVGRDGT